jgi:predicted nucleic acid-binding protein
MIFMSADTELQFVDTDVLVYAYDASAGARHAQAQTLLAELWKTGLGCLSIQALQEFYVTLTRKVAVPLPAGSAAQIVTDLGHT